MPSTLSLAHCVFLRNLRLDFIEGLLLKQLIFTIIDSSSQPYSSTRTSSIVANFTPCKGLLGCSSGCVFSLSIILFFFFHLFVFYYRQIDFVFYNYSFWEFIN